MTVEGEATALEDPERPSPAVPNVERRVVLKVSDERVPGRQNRFAPGRLGVLPIAVNVREVRVIEIKPGFVQVGGEPKACARAAFWWRTACSVRERPGGADLDIDQWGHGRVAEVDDLHREAVSLWSRAADVKERDRHPAQALGAAQHVAGSVDELETSVLARIRDE